VTHAHLWKATWLVLYSLVINVFLKDCSYHNRPESEEAVVQSDVPVIEDALSAVETVEGKVELGNREDHIFIEEVKNALSYSQIAKPPVIKDKLPEASKLSNCIITSLYSSHSFVTINSHTNLRFLDHIDVISSIAYGQGYLFQSILDKFNNLCFLLRSHTTTYNRLAINNNL